MRRTRRLYAGATAAACALLLAGCGIRPTEVPTDFGAAPSLVPCSISGADTQEARSGGEFPAQVFLVCTSQLVSVERTVTVPEDSRGDRVQVAQRLLDELQRTPSTQERQAGYTTDVEAGTKVTGPREGDPDEALRLSTPPDDLSPYALAQIVCTFVSSKAAGDGDDVVLGGPGGDPLRGYACTPGVKARPGLIPVPTETVG